VGSNELIGYLSRFLTRERLNLFERIVENRTRYITVVLEDIHQTQNASAVLRSCECFGIQDVHIIENQNPFRLNTRVTLGSAKWLNLNRYNKQDDNTPETLRQLKQSGYRIVATSPDPSAIALGDFDLFRGKTALIFGSEKPGISRKVEACADEFLTIPMVGFTESLNISVSAATILYDLTTRLRKSTIDWKLTLNEADELMLDWMRKHIKRSDLLEKRFWEEKTKSIQISN
jgi:tRNA (guanosine-2'-O-)-methyltransferase